MFRDPALINTFSSVSTNPYATGPGRLELGVHQYGLLGGCGRQHRIPCLARRVGPREPTRKRSVAVDAVRDDLLNRIFDYLMVSLRSLPLVMVIGRPEARIPVVSFAVHDVPAERVVQRLADNGILAISNANSRVLDVIGVNDVGGAVTVGLAHYSTMAEVDQLVRALASLG